MRALKVAGIFLFGLIVGGFIALYLAGRAAPTFSRGLEIGAIFEQQRQASVAAQNGRWLEAAAINRNIAFLESKTGKPFGVENQQWDLLYPLAALVLERIAETSDPNGRVKAISAGAAYAKYAFTLEKAGREEEAGLAWDQALKLGSFPSIESARNLAAALMKQEMEFFNAH